MAFECTRIASFSSLVPTKKVKISERIRLSSFSTRLGKQCDLLVEGPSHLFQSQNSAENVFFKCRQVAEILPEVEAGLYMPRVYYSLAANGLRKRVTDSPINLGIMLARAGIVIVMLVSVGLICAYHYSRNSSFTACRASGAAVA
jgi:hypothetical protein